jgi:hypothetical protein
MFAAFGWTRCSTRVSTISSLSSARSLPRKMLSLTFASGTKRLSTVAEQSEGETSACVSAVVP